MRFYYFSHFIQVWLLPPGFNLLIALIGILLLWNHPGLGKCLVLFSVLSLWVLSTPTISHVLIKALLYQYPVLEISTVKSLGAKSPGAIIVLGGGSIESPEYKNKYVINKLTLSRLRYAVYLYQETQLPMIVSGGKLIGVSKTEAELMSNDLKNYFKIDAEWQEDKSITTEDEAKFMVPILKEHGIKVAYLVTDAWHIPRAMYTFNNAFKDTDIKIIAAPMGAGPKINMRHTVFDYLPSLGALNTSTVALHEYIGLLSYQLKIKNYSRL